MAPLAAAAEDLTLGTWERNVRESKSSGADPWVRQIVVREAVPGGVKQTVTAEMKDGTKRRLVFTMLYDGTPSRIEGAPAAWDTVVTRRIDGRTSTFETYDSRGGKYKVSGKSVVSEDGRRMTTWQKGIGATGEPLEFVVVYDRVAPAPSPGPAVEQWSREKLAEMESQLTRSAVASCPSFEVLVRKPGTVAALLHRAKTGEAELHEEMADFFAVQSGSATLVFGGKLKGGRTTGKGEHAGDGIENGTTRRLAQGDVVHIPPGIPHHVVLAPGETITYLLIKSKE
ncbi:MAG: hypothetical protein JNL98_03650 [Bryobacterales bacterium]|nr:hypothetical protein [Bryobacterales bacterium]